MISMTWTSKFDDDDDDDDDDVAADGRYRYYTHMIGANSVAGNAQVTSCDCRRAIFAFCSDVPSRGVNSLCRSLLFLSFLRVIYTSMICYRGVAVSTFELIVYA